MLLETAGFADHAPVVSVRSPRRLDAATRSGARVVSASDAERRRLERDLHDGAQQRLVSLAVQLRLLAMDLAPDSDQARLLATAQEQLAASLQELRELASGLPPAVLDRGLDAALSSVALRAPLPVAVTVDVDQRPGTPVEIAAYYLVSETLTNVAKYAGATTATVTVTREHDDLVVEVADDGVGGADPSRGSGLRGLADRVNALGGSVHVSSPRGQGTTVRAEIPCPPR
jgi:signal transduction histidine kinase